MTGGYPAPVTTYTLRSASPAKTRADVVVVGVLQGAKGAELAPGGEDVADAYGRNLRPLLAHLGVSGKPGEVVKVPTGKTIAAGLLVLVGLGKAVTPLAVRRATGATARAVTNAASVSLALPADTPGLVRAATEGWLLGGYTFMTCKQDTATPATSPGTVGVLSPIARQAEAIAAFTDAQVLAAAVLGTRDWVNTPPGDFTPERFVEAVTALHAEVTKARRAAPDADGAGRVGAGRPRLRGILGVGGGSSAPPRLVELSDRPEGAVAHVALVGKGITFDSGGLTIKPATGMTTMKSDMAGAAAVLQATVAVARLGLPVRVSAFAPMAENMVSGSAMRPGDVLTMYGGRTVEVTNTDARGPADPRRRAGPRGPRSSRTRSSTWRRSPATWCWPSVTVWAG